MNYELFLIFERVLRLLGAFETDTPQKHRATSRMWLLLKFISENINVTGSEVARRFLIKHPTATQLIERGVKDGFIVRVASQNDRRVHYLTLSKLGSQQVSILSGIYNERASVALKYLSDKEHEQLLKLMNKIAFGLETEISTEKYRETYG
jgi:DNA-binding MarR family transcriptional regulator